MDPSHVCKYTPHIQHPKRMKVKSPKLSKGLTNMVHLNKFSHTKDSGVQERSWTVMSNKTTHMSPQKNRSTCKGTNDYFDQERVQTTSNPPNKILHDRFRQRVKRLPVKQNKLNIHNKCNLSSENSQYSQGTQKRVRHRTEK